MHLTERFLSFTLLGSEWVLWVLIALSVVSIAIMIERAFYFATHRLEAGPLPAVTEIVLTRRQSAGSPSCSTRSPYTWPPAWATMSSTGRLLFSSASTIIADMPGRISVVTDWTKSESSASRTASPVSPEVAPF